MLGVLTGARQPAQRRMLPPDVPWPERVLCCMVGDVEVVNVHSPISQSPDLAKVRTHEALSAYLAAPGAGPRILCGDLNTPRRELLDGEVLTFAPTTAPGGCGPSAASAGTPPSVRSSAACAITAGSTSSARCTVTGSATRAGPLPAIAAAGAWTTRSSTGCAPSQAPTPTTGGAPA
jgi:hypothetical protein